MGQDLFQQPRLLAGLLKLRFYREIVELHNGYMPGLHSFYLITITIIATTVAMATIA